MTNNKWANEILEANMEGYTQEERKQYLDDVRAHGCQGGSVGGVIYYHETAQIFKDNMENILDLIAEYEEETGYNPIPKIVEEGNTFNLYNYLVWYVVELTAQNMLDMIEDEEEAV